MSSDSLRIGLIAEGPTDHIVIEAILNSILLKKQFRLVLLQPEYSEAFNQYGILGTGWGGVYRWCQQSISANGSVSQDVLFENYDLLLVHVDADVAGKKYSDARIENGPGDLPCDRPCPPASDTTNALRSVILRWMNETTLPSWIVLCIPSKNTEAWVMKALFPNDREINQYDDWECFPNPEIRLSLQPLGSRIMKNKEDYQSHKVSIQSAWSSISSSLTEARRFDIDLRNAFSYLEFRK